MPPNPIRLLAAGAFSPPDAPSVDSVHDDPRLWLEDVEGEAQLAWVKAKNDEATGVLGDPKESPTYARILSILESKEKIPYIGRVLLHKEVAGVPTLDDLTYYNFWQDAVHVKGIWRRCSLAEYKKPEPDWETMLDLDALSKKDGTTWVWGGSTILKSSNLAPVDRTLIALSRGGADAKVVREYDFATKDWVPESETPFTLPEAKASYSWLDRDTLIVGGSFFGQDGLTDSGYPRTARLWKRGTPLESAVEIFRGEKTDVAAGVSITRESDETRYWIKSRSITFWTSSYELAIVPPGGAQPDLSKPFTAVPMPEDAGLGTFQDQLMISLRSDWLGYAKGSMLAAPAAALMKLTLSDEEALKALLKPLFEPTDSCSLEGSSETKNYVIISVLNNVRNEIRYWRYDKSSGFSLERTHLDEGFAMTYVGGLNAAFSDDLVCNVSSYLQPTTVALSHAATPGERTPLKALPAFYDASGLHVEQFHATSLDGTQVPYFLVSRKAMKLDGTTPTLLYGYGGFEISMTPGYAATVGVGWLEKGYAYAVANIRGGGEFGPRWHQAALKEKRHKAYEDFEAVAKHLVERGVTTPAKLGCQGGSNGGLLTGNMVTRAPELFGAIVVQVPLLDMRRFNVLLAGASWMGEYGNPDDPEEWKGMQAYSAYHTLSSTTTPTPTLFTTSTRDDRVHPGHARKMAGKMVELGLPALSYENIEGGHGGAADNKQRAFMSTLTFTFLEKALSEKAILPALANRTNTDGGRARLTSAKYKLRSDVSTVLTAAARSFKGVPADKTWMLPVLAAAGVYATLALQMVAARRR